MKVKELIEQPKELEQDAEVLVFVRKEDMPASIVEEDGRVWLGVEYVGRPVDW